MLQEDPVAHDVPSETLISKFLENLRWRLLLQYFLFLKKPIRRWQKKLQETTLWRFFIKRHLLLKKLKKEFAKRDPKENTFWRTFLRVFFLLKKLIRRFPKNNSKLEKRIKHFTRLYSLELYTYLHIKQKEVFGTFLGEEAFKCLLINFRVRHGDREDYWYSLFFFLTGEEPAQKVNEKMTEDEQAFWDIIIPLGSKYLKKYLKKRERKLLRRIPWMIRYEFQKDTSSINLLEINIKDLSIVLSTKTRKELAGPRRQGEKILLLSYVPGPNLYKGFSEKWKLKQELF